jgi:hypothetical protein
VKTLPRTAPNLEYLKREAAELKRQHGHGDASICADLRHYEFSFTDRTDAEILAAPFALNDAQRITARQYGFSSWSKLKSYVENSAQSRQRQLAQRLIDAEQTFTEQWDRLRDAQVGRFDSRILQLHSDNADLVSDCMEQHGCLDAGLVGHEGAEAAFLLVANSYTQGPLNHRVIDQMQSSVDQGASPLRGLAMLQDRALWLRGAAVIYGCVGDFDADGRLTIGNDVIDPDNLNRRRALAGFDAIEASRRQIIETYADRDDVLRPDPQKYAEERRELASVGNW